ncbi:MAG TPA: carboxypeptidase-like regulatory domain-containing protein [Xylanibacter oryzae]|uniref:carboxypeptidase-like regulatory domain-containing protein n=1 Tax=Xylanibacter oryzae TaxID=185293 RepID=UPI0004B13E97|nr:carboxypeptidase-like regulatory domain-containing protein [Xylanibacter oryzae]HRN15764.1 carboxypeptidase-like regulatory domain-containing protein [Xylanibacter oryzae]
MKTFISRAIGILLFTMIAGTLTSSAQTDDYFTVSGIVKSQSNKKAVEFANVSVNGTNIGTVTNEDGEFTLKIKKSTKANAIVVSLIGYSNSWMNIGEENIDNAVIWLKPKQNLLDEVVVEASVSRNIVAQAIRNIDKNYGTTPTLLTGFYRETARKGNHYINISEAVVHMFKTGYNVRNANSDRVQVIKGRKLLSEKASDTLAVRLIGGPNMSAYMDVVKNPDGFLDESTLNYYSFMMEKPVYIDHRIQYVISFKPMVNLEYALFEGKLYIDKESLAVTRAELSLDMSDKNKVTQTILKKKPFGLVFKPQELTFLINYEERNGKMCLSYMRNEVKFKCNWKKRLFHTSYGVVSEMVVTDKDDNNVEKIPYRESFKEDDSFTDKVKAFYDEDFWGNYNILAPTESLDKAVTKLKKQHKDMNN